MINSESQIQMRRGFAFVELFPSEATSESGLIIIPDLYQNIRPGRARVIAVGAPDLAKKNQRAFPIDYKVGDEVLVKKWTLSTTRTGHPSLATYEININGKKRKLLLVRHSDVLAVIDRAGPDDNAVVE